MIKCKKTWMAAMLVIVCVPSFAQDVDDELEAQMREAERRLVESERERVEAEREMEQQRAENEREMAEMAREMERERAERERLIRDENIEIEVRLREAESAMAEAAQRVAELSRQNLPRVQSIERIFGSGGRPVIGITIATADGEDPVEGVSIMGVSPGGAADEAGLRGGDVITTINGESLTSGNEREASEKLLDFMKGVEEGDILDVEYLRNGRSHTVQLEPRPAGGVFAFNFDGSDFTMPDVQVSPHVNQFVNRYVWLGGNSGFGDMEMVKLSGRLGRYFGADEGILVVRGPENEELKLQDGDVILEIDGRKPTSVSHAMRILGSYQAGETVTIEIMRDKRRQTVSIDVPDNRQSFVAPHPLPKVEAVPAVKAAPPADRM